MVHMHSCFNLRHGEKAQVFQERVRQFTQQLREAGLVHSVGAIGRRLHHPILDTDDERDQEFYFVMTFESRAQCDRAVDRILGRDQPMTSMHETVFEAVCDPVFTCWEDIGPDQ